MYWGKGSALSTFIASTMVLIWGTLAFLNFGATVMITSEASKTATSTDVSPLPPATTEHKKSSLAPDPARELTPEELRQLEIKMQYSGDDEIIRERLGLPPKSHQEKSSSTDSESATNPTSGIKTDDTAPQSEEQKSSSE